MTTWNVVGTTEHVALGEMQQDGGVDGQMNDGQMSYDNNAINSVDQSAALQHWIEAFDHHMTQGDAPNDVEAAIAALDADGCPDPQAVADMWIHQQENPETTEDLSQVPPAEDPSMTPAPQDVAQAPQQPLASTKKTAYTAQDVQNWIQQGVSEEAIRYELSLGGQEALYDEAVGAQAPQAPQAPQGGGSLRQRIMGQPMASEKTADMHTEEYGGTEPAPFEAIQEDPTIAAKEWLHDCFDGEEGAAEAIEAMSPEETQAKVEQFYDGGWAEFLRNGESVAPDHGYTTPAIPGGESPMDEDMRAGGDMVYAKTADLAGKGPRRDKANEIYKAIRRDHPDQDKSSAAAIANDEANDLEKKGDLALGNDDDDKKGNPFAKKDDKSDDKGKSDKDSDSKDDKDDDDGKPPWLKKKDSRASYQGLNGTIAATFDDLWTGPMVVLATEHGDLTLSADEVEPPVGEEAPADNPVQEINEFLSIIDPAGHVPASYHARIHNLGQVIAAGTKVIKEGKVSLADQMALDEIIIKSRIEITELTKLAEEYTTQDDVDYAEALPQYGIGAGGVFEQADVGHQSDGSWLDEVYHEQMSDAQATDFDQIVSEEPALLVSDMPDTMLADQGAAAEYATSYISSKTHSIPEEIRKEIHTAFVAKVEQARRSALGQRKASMKTAAAALPEADGPAEGLFR